VITYALLIAGFAALIKGADWLVDGASSLAKRLGVSTLVIGLTIVAFGTSMPELMVNLLSSVEGKTDLAIGNVVGSNIANILLILGVSAVIRPLAVQSGTVWREIPFALLAVLVMAALGLDQIVNGTGDSALTRGDGLVLIAFFVIFLYYVFGIAKESANVNVADEVAIHSLGPSWLLVLGGLGALMLGGKWVVDGAVKFASMLGVSEALIGLTVVAVGTSLPELATSAVAAYKGNVDIAVGNVVGSNIFNVFWILGVSASVHPLPLSPVLAQDLFVALLATLLLFGALFVGRRHELERWQGALFAAAYAAYAAFLVGRG
jgi:cation:H+ antiporter